jgi:hypothetical protein
MQRSNVEQNPQGFLKFKETFLHFIVEASQIGLVRVFAKTIQRVDAFPQTYTGHA